MVPSIENCGSVLFIICGDSIGRIDVQSDSDSGQSVRHIKDGDQKQYDIRFCQVGV